MNFKFLGQLLELGKKKHKNKTISWMSLRGFTAVLKPQELQGAAFARRRFSSGDGRETLPKSGDVASLPSRATATDVTIS